MNADGVITHRGASFGLRGKVLPWPEGPGKASTQSSVIFGPKLIDISGKNVSTLILEKSSDLSRFRDCISPYF
jgi:hypothetical protein